MPFSGCLFSAGQILSTIPAKKKKKKGKRQSKLFSSAPSVSYWSIKESQGVTAETVPWIRARSYQCINSVWALAWTEQEPMQGTRLLSSSPLNRDSRDSSFVTLLEALVLSGAGFGKTVQCFVTVTQYRHPHRLSSTGGVQEREKNSSFPCFWRGDANGDIFKVSTGQHWIAGCVRHFMWPTGIPLGCFLQSRLTLPPPFSLLGNFFSFLQWCNIQSWYCLVLLLHFWNTLQQRSLNLYALLPFQCQWRN